MEDWVVNLIVGLSTALLGFLGGFFAKSLQVKNIQKIKGNSNKQSIGDVSNGK